MRPRSKGKMTSRTMPSGFSTTASATRQNCIFPSAGFTVTPDTLSLSIAKSEGKQLVALEEFAEERRRFIRDADDLVRCLTIEFEIELGSGLAVIPVGEMFELAPPQRPLRERGGLMVRLTRGVCRAIPRFFAIALAEVTTPRAMRPCPPSFSLANTKTVSPSAICLPPNIVFCAVNANVFARGSQTSALIANAMHLLSRPK
jgi:hypothetical protein